MSKDVIVALDFDSYNKTMTFLKQFKNPIYVKVGMELFYQEGPSIIKEIKTLGHKIFLDLKIHDIPNTAKGALTSLKNLDIDMVNVHCAGGIAMMKQALEVFQDSKTLLIGVTQLTSSDEAMLKEELLIDKPINEVVLKYALNAKEAGLDGVVCSPLEAQIIHEEIGYDFKTICPGIRYEASGDDQKRTTNPKEAHALTCDYIVVGRPITQAKQP
ncbi:MAG: orotidine-5'-phosphate decarboxylase, partial [Bacilli bacterium]